MALKPPPPVTERLDRYGGFLIEAEFVPMPAENLRVFARSLLDPIRQAYQNPEFEAEYQKWKKEQEEKKHA